MEEEPQEGGAVLTGLHAERFRRTLEQIMRGGKLRSGRVVWLGGDRFRLEGEFTLLELTCIYVAARDCYPAGTIDGRRVRGALPPWW